MGSSKPLQETYAIRPRNYSRNQRRKTLRLERKDEELYISTIHGELKQIEASFEKCLFGFEEAGGTAESLSKSYEDLFNQHDEKFRKVCRKYQHGLKVLKLDEDRFSNYYKPKESLKPEAK